MNRTGSIFNNSLTANSLGTDVLDAFVEFFRSYQGLRSLILEGQKQNVIRPTELAYRLWHPRNKDFIADLRAVVASPGGELIAQQIDGVGWHESNALQLKEPVAPSQVHPDARSTQLPLSFNASDDAELEIYLVQEHVHPFEYKAILLEAKIEIRNRTTKPKYVGPFVIESPNDGGHHIHDHEVARALYELKKLRPPELHGVIGPADNLSGWLHASLAHQPWGGVGAYSIKMDDELGIQYTLRRDRRPGREPPSSQSTPDSPTPRTGKDG